MSNITQPGNTSTLMQSVVDLTGINKPLNYSPVLHRPLNQHLGIEITGSFMTNDATEYGELSYITVFRTPNSTAPHDGLGFAWKKSRTITGAVDADGNPIPNASAYNIFLVDNDALQENAYISNETLISDDGLNSFIAAGKFNIEAEQIYNFKLQVLIDYRVKVWVAKSGDFFSASPTIQVGAKKYDRGVSAGSTYDGNAPFHFGFSVGETKGYEWWYDNIKIESLTNNYPIILYRIDVSDPKFNASKGFNVRWKGWGSFDTNKNGAKSFIWNDKAQSWELLGANTAKSTSTDSQKTISKELTPLSNYTADAWVSQQYVNVLASPTEPHADSMIATQHVEVDNLIASGVHQGNTVDIYTNAPSRMEEAITTISNLTGAVSVLNLNSDFTMPIQEIISVHWSGGDELQLGDDFTIVHNSPELAFSENDNISLHFDQEWNTTTMNVTYRYYADGGILQDTVQNSGLRAPGVSNLIKITPPVVITIEDLDYRGDLHVDTLKTTIRDWINSLTTSFEITDFIAYLYGQGITYINLDTLSIKYRRYNYLGTLVEQGVSITDIYTLPPLTAFYTHVNEMIGITKLD